MTSLNDGMLYNLYLWGFGGLPPIRSEWVKDVKN